MTRFKKLKNKIEQKKTPSDITYDELEKYLNHYGYYLKNVAGSHHKFVKDDKNSLIIPVHNNKVKSHYVHEAAILIKREED